MRDSAVDADSTVTPIDARPDSTPDADNVTCRVGLANTTGSDRGRVGGNGGSENFAPLACPVADDRIVGIELRMSNQDTVFGGRSAHGIGIACATVSVRSSGLGMTGTVTTLEISGNGGSSWSPSTWTPITQCKPGWIVSGLQAHTGNNSNRFIDAAIRCSQIGPTGTIVATEILDVAGSLTETQGVMTVNCNANEILARMPNRSGTGLDSVNLFCTQPTCN
jgi:hypothetical protein